MYDTSAVMFFSVCACISSNISHLVRGFRDDMRFDVLRMVEGDDHDLLGCNAM
jgi:hypothetical protein